MKLHLAAAVAALGLAAAGPAFAERLVVVGYTEDSVSFAEIDNITRTGQNAEMWVLTVHTGDTRSWPSKPYRYSRSLWEVQCDARLSAGVILEIFDKTSRRIDRTDFAREWMTADPGSTGEVMMDVACGKADFSGDEIFDSEPADLFDFVGPFIAEQNGETRT